MAIEKEKVIARYKLKFGSVGLSQTRLDEVAAKLGSKMADDAPDEEIDARLEDLNDYHPFADVKKNDDRIVNEKKNPNKKPVKEEVKTEDDDDAPAWAKAMLAKIEKLESEKAHDTLETKFRKDERLKGVPEFVLKRSIPKSEEEYEETVGELETEYKVFAEQNKLAAFGADTPPNGKPKPVVEEVKQISPEDAKAIVAGMNS